MMQTAEYLLAGALAEVERLRLQARVWEPEAERMLDEIGINRGSIGIDVGCGPMGILGLLARRAGPNGLVVGLDSDPAQLEAARQYAAEHGFGNVEIRRGDLFAADLTAGRFDVVHARFVLAPIGREQEILDQLLRLARPGGVIALEEPDAETWQCYPRSAAWDCLKIAVLDAFTSGGGDFSAGARIASLLRSRRIRRVRVRDAVLTLPGSHPYARLLLQFARALRPKILSRAFLDELQLDDAIERCEEALEVSSCFIQSFRLVQAWGWKR